MDPVEQLLAREEIKELKARYGRFIDQKRWDDWQALFTDDAELITAGGKEVGPAAIRAMVEREMHQIPSSHQSFCPEITFVDDSTATAIWACMFVQAEGRTTGVGHYYDKYRKTDNRWLIASCELVTAFVEGNAISGALEDRP